MNEILSKLAKCVEVGKIDKNTSYPPNMKDQDGATELTKIALDNGIKPIEILEKALIPAMGIVGNKFSRNEIYVPQMLISAKAMQAAMVYIKPFFLEGETKRKGTFIIGTVLGDMHDIGKNLVAIMIEGSGWEVIDLGTNVEAEKFLKTIDEKPGATVGLSALLTTTMENMKKTVAALKEKHKDLKILVGGAPVNKEFCEKMGADFYSPDPQGAVNYLETLVI